MKRLLMISFAIIFLFSLIPDIYASSAMPKFLCEIGLKFYRQGRYDEALQEFKKALMVEPDYEPAIRYIQIIEQKGSREAEKKEIVPTTVPITFKPTSTTTSGAIKEILDLIEIQQEMIQEEKLLPAGIISPLTKPAEKKYPPKILVLDESIKTIPQPIELEQGKEIILQVRNLQKFLVTYPNVLLVTKNQTGDLLIVGQETGYADLVVWDENGRNLLDFLVIPPKPEGPLYEDILKKELEREEGFSLHYSMGWSSFEKGRRLDELERQSYSYRHNLMLKGSTPYGNLDSSITVQSLRTTRDLTYATIGLVGGQFGPFSKFNLRGIDFSPYFSNLVFSGSSLRGVMLESPAFDAKLRYITFWGREGGGRYGALSPGLTKIKHHFLDGFNLSYQPTKEQVYETSVIHGWGRDRPADLYAYGYDASLKYLFDKWNIGYELGFDSETTGSLLNAGFKLPKGNFAFEFRDIDKKFQSMAGLGNRAGEIGSIINFDYEFTDKLSTLDQLSVYKDRLNPSRENRNRLNIDNDWGLNYSIDDTSSLRMDYGIQNDLGKLSEYRYNTAGVTYSKSIDLIKKINTYSGFRYLDARYMTYHPQDYTNRKAIAGLSFNIIDNFNFSLSKEYNWLDAVFTSDRSNPEVMEANLDWSGEIGRSNLFGSWRLSYRDEENADSTVSYLSGQDYVDNFAEIAYRPNKDTELFCSNRVRNIWQEKEGVNKEMEVEFNAGMRYIWDTGFRWESVGSVDVYVFKDVNLDGLRQRDEAPVEGIKIYVGKNKYEVTDIFGYCRFKKVKAKNAYVTLDDKSIPRGHVLTTPITQMVRIISRKAAVINFGLAAHTEMSGIVFVDKNNNGKFDAGEITVPSVILVLENGKTAKTDTHGYYSFYNISAGAHTIMLQLESLPFQYLPLIPIKKEVVIYEGVTYNYDLPLKVVSNE